MKHNKKYDDLLILYFNNELSGTVKTDFQEHLKQCSMCQIQLAKMQKLEAVITSDIVKKPTDALLNKLNMQVMEKITVDEKSEFFKAVRNKVADLFGVIVARLARPQYQLIAIGLVFVIGVFVGKVWLRSELQNDLAVFTNFVNYQMAMTDIQKSNLQKALANYMLKSGSVEIDNLLQASGDNNGNGVVEVNLKVEKDFALKGGLDDPTIQNMLKYSAIHDLDAERRMHAIKLLSQAVPNPEIETTLIAVLLRDPSPDVRLKAIQLLYKQSVSDQVVEAYKLVALRDSSAQIRKTAVERLYRVGKEEIIPVLALVCSQERDESIKLTAQNAIDMLYEKLQKTKK